MLFGVPTMYHRLAEALARIPGSPRRWRGAAARLGFRRAAPPRPRADRGGDGPPGRRAVRDDGDPDEHERAGGRGDRPGTVGVPLPGVGLRLVEEDGTRPTRGRRATIIGEIQVRGPNLFTGYLNRPDATAAAYTATAGSAQATWRSSTPTARSGSSAARPPT